MDNYSIKIIKKPDVTDLAGEKVMIDFETGKYFMLTGSANDIWDLLGEKTTVLDIVNALLGMYEVDKTVCENEVMTFLNKLVEIGFVELEKSV